MWLLSFFILNLAWADPAIPFWKSKEKVYNRIQNREIIVVVKTIPENGRNQLHIQGGGQVSAARDSVFKKAMDFERLSLVSGYIKEAKFDAKKQELAVKFSAFAYNANFTIKIDVHDKNEPKQLGFNVIDGSLKGLNGVFSFAAIKPEKTEVGIDGKFLYDKFPVPQFFLEFGMEVVFQRMAARLREYAESE